MSTAAAPRALTPAQLRAYEDEGFLVMRSFLGRAAVEAIRDTFTRQGADGPVPGLSDSNRLTPGEPLAKWPRMMHPHRHPDKPVGPLALRHMLNAALRDILWDVLGEEPIAAQSMFYFKPPGARGQDFHQDNFYLRVKPGTCLAAWMAVDDADQGNGGLVVVPGTHRLDVLCPEPSDRSRFFTTEHLPVPPGHVEHPVELTAGDMLIFNGSLIHGSYPNTSRDRFRRALICHYVPWGCAQVAHWYRPLLRFDGTVVHKADATGGGPCGTVQAMAKGPH
jgi:ectoine hydroxylase-related dioxygenase (phytanoyl-CoA dioxygenase family)